MFCESDLILGPSDTFCSRAGREWNDLHSVTLYFLVLPFCFCLLSELIISFLSLEHK